MLPGAGPRQPILKCCPGQATGAPRIMAVRGQRSEVRASHKITSMPLTPLKYLIEYIDFFNAPVPPDF